jgi:hypothetical protein
MSPRKDVGPDFALETPNGKIFVEVKRRMSADDRVRLLEKVRRSADESHDRVVVTLLADNDRILVYRGIDTAPAAELPTVAIVTAYDPDFEREVVYEDYLSSLVRAWLNDFSFSRTGVEPPGTRDLPEDVLAALAA